jgi:sugar diacid utilization regulator
VLEEEHGRRQGGLLRDLLLNPQPEVRRTASAAIAAEHGWAPDAHYGVLVATVDGAGGEHDARVDELVDVAERARRRWRWGQLLWVLDGAALLVLARLLPTPDEDLDAAVRLLLDAGATQIAAGAPSDGVLGAHAAFRQARAAQGVLERVPDLGPACRWDRLGSWALVAETLACEEPRTPEPIRRLLEEPGGPALLQALEATLDHGGDVAAIAASLSMHRATLYRRLRRVEEITGLSLTRGDDRLVLHLGLRLHRLAGPAA